jgi:hypothetical protein
MQVSGQLHAPAALPQRKAPDTHSIRGWVGPRAVLDAVVKRKVPSPRQESNSRTPIVQTKILLVISLFFKIPGASYSNQGSMSATKYHIPSRHAFRWCHLMTNVYSYVNKLRRQQDVPYLPELEASSDLEFKYTLYIHVLLQFPFKYTHAKSK